MHPSSQQYSQALYDLLQKTDQREGIFQTFYQYLQKRGEEKKWLTILKITEVLLKKEANRETLWVTTAHELGSQEKDLITLQAQSIFPGKQFDWYYQVKPDVLGGFQIRSEDMLYDATLQKSLNQFSQTLTS